MTEEPTKKGMWVDAPDICAERNKISKLKKDNGVYLRFRENEKGEVVVVGLVTLSS